MQQKPRAFSELTTEEKNMVRVLALGSMDDRTDFTSKDIGNLTNVKVSSITMIKANMRRGRILV